MLSNNIQTSSTELAPVFAALGDQTRLSLMLKLSDGQTRSISELAEDSELTRQAITKHLRVLETEALVRSSRHGRETRFTFQPERFDDLNTFLTAVSRKWDQALLRLKNHVE